MIINPGAENPFIIRCVIDPQKLHMQAGHPKNGLCQNGPSFPSNHSDTPFNTIPGPEATLIPRQTPETEMIFVRSCISSM